MSAKKQTRVSPELLRWNCDLELLPFETTEEIDPAHGVVGQPTAYEALKLAFNAWLRAKTYTCAEQGGLAESQWFATC